jgi:hypothetical protein
MASRKFQVPRKREWKSAAAEEKSRRYLLIRCYRKHSPIHTTERPLLTALTAICKLRILAVIFRNNTPKLSCQCQEDRLFLRLSLVKFHPSSPSQPFDHQETRHRVGAMPSLYASDHRVAKLLVQQKLPTRSLNGRPSECGVSDRARQFDPEMNSSLESRHYLSLGVGVGAPSVVTGSRYPPREAVIIIYRRDRGSTSDWLGMHHAGFSGETGIST